MPENEWNDELRRKAEGFRLQPDAGMFAQLNRKRQDRRTHKRMAYYVAASVVLMSVIAGVFLWPGANTTLQLTQDIPAAQDAGHQPVETATLPHSGADPSPNRNLKSSVTESEVTPPVAQTNHDRKNEPVNKGVASPVNTGSASTSAAKPRRKPVKANAQPLNTAEPGTALTSMAIAQQTKEVDQPAVQVVRERKRKGTRPASSPVVQQAGQPEQIPSKVAPGKDPEPVIPADVRLTAKEIKPKGNPGQHDTQTSDTGQAKASKSAEPGRGNELEAGQMLFTGAPVTTDVIKDKQERVFDAADTTGVTEQVTDKIMPRKELPAQWIVDLVWSSEMVRFQYTNSPNDPGWASVYRNNRQQHDQPGYCVRVGVNIDRVTDQHFSIGTGLFVTNTRFTERRNNNYLIPKTSVTSMPVSNIKMAYDSGNVEVLGYEDVQNSFTYLEVPLTMTYRKSMGRFDLAVQGGVHFRQLIGVTAYAYYSNDSLNVHEVSSISHSTLNQQVLLLSAGARVGYMLNKNWFINLGPAYRMGLSSLYSKAYMIRQTPSFFGVDLGLQYRF